MLSEQSPAVPAPLAHLPETLATLLRLADKVARVHGVPHPNLLDVRDGVQELRDAVEARLAAASPAAGWQALVADHLEVSSLLETLRAASGDFLVPENACGSFSRLYRELEALEAVLLRHLYLEQRVPGAPRG